MPTPSLRKRLRPLRVERVPGAVNAQDVARYARVSTASVSRALNNVEGIGEAARQRVLAAAAKLGYVPHGAALALATQRSQTVGALLPALDKPGIAVMLAALQERLRASGFSLLIATTSRDRKRDLEEVRLLLSRGIDGLLLVGADHTPQLYELLNAKQIPFVTTLVAERASPHAWVGFGNAEVSYRLAQYLLELGHREFAVISEPAAHNDRARGRIAGVRRALEERGMALPPERIIEGEGDIAQGRMALRQLAAQSKRATAVICTDDLFAFGALTECAQLKIRVPQDMSICGFDDHEFAAHLDPALTTVHVPFDEVGKHAGEWLLGSIADGKARANVRVAVSIIVRGSAAAPGKRFPPGKAGGKQLISFDE